ncbi:hypothetical protein [Chitinophaga lutea]|uniref:hypothetical protein n=1 Tax=Chitinophaga lutea TaxID=2488634 RepID=UPI000F4E1037|nr:hypothetical protein [Chitinophaga lutea]
MIQRFNRIHFCRKPLIVNYCRRFFLSILPQTAKLALLAHFPPEKGLLRNAVPFLKTTNHHPKPAKNEIAPGNPCHGPFFI